MNATNLDTDFQFELYAGPSPKNQDSLISYGGFGTVYGIEGVIPLALKVIKVDDLDEEVFRKVTTETSIQSYLADNIPNIPLVFDSGFYIRPEKGFLYCILMERAGQYDGAGEFQDALPIQKALVGSTQRQALDRFLEATSTVGKMHDYDFIHRDIKPENILVGDLGDHHLIDFGLAIRKGVVPTIRPGYLAPGTLPYMSPEQLNGASLDQRSDIFSLSATLVELLTGKRPYELAGNNSQTEAEQMVFIFSGVTDYGELVRTRARIPDPLNRVLARGLSVSKGFRQPDVQTFQDELSQAASRCNDELMYTSTKGIVSPRAPTLLHQPVQLSI